MALVYGTPTETIGAASGGPYSGPITFSHDNGGDGLLKVEIALNRNTTTAITPTCTYNSVAMTRVGMANNSNVAAARPDVAIFLLESPASGSNTVSITLNADASSYAAEATGVTGFKSGDLVGTDSDSVVTGGSGASLNVTTDADGSDLIMAYSARDPNNHAPLAPGTGVTEEYEANSGLSDSNNQILIGFYTKTIASAGAATIDCTASATDSQAAIAIELKVATGGPTASLLLMQQSFRQ